MNLLEITNQITENHNTFIRYMNSLSSEDYNFSLKDEKWTAGQEIDHVNKSITALIKALKMPKLALRATFGVANRKSKTFYQLIEKYKAKLENNTVSLGRFTPEKFDEKEKVKQLEVLSHNVEKLVNLSSKYSETDLDKYILPHPLLGKLTLREMLFFTNYHVSHHLNNSKRNLNKKKSSLKP